MIALLRLFIAKLFYIHCPYVIPIYLNSTIWQRTTHLAYSVYGILIQCLKFKVLQLINNTGKQVLLSKYVTGNFRGVISIKRVKQKHNADMVASHLNVQLRNCHMDFADTWYLKFTLKCILLIKFNIG